MNYLTLPQIQNLILWLLAVLVARFVSKITVLRATKSLFIWTEKKITYKIYAAVWIKLFKLLIGLCRPVFHSNKSIYLSIINHFNKLRLSRRHQSKRIPLKKFIVLGKHKLINLKPYLNELTDSSSLSIVSKPLYNVNNVVFKPSKSFIRSSRWFTKTKYSSVRQECKNIVHFVLLLNTFFVFNVFNVYMHWCMIPSNTVIVVGCYIVINLRVLIRVTKVFKFWSGLLNK